MVLTAGLWYVYSEVLQEVIKWSFWKRPRARGTYRISYSLERGISFRLVNTDGVYPDKYEFTWLLVYYPEYLRYNGR
jgi:IS1 family transposase